MNTASIHNDDNADPRLEHNLATKVTIKSADMGSTMTRKLPNESENRHQDNHLEPHSGSDSDHLSTFRRPAPSSKADSNASLLEPSDSVRRSRSGRPLRSTVQQNDPSRRSSSAEAPESIGKRTRSFTSSRVGASGCDPQDRLTEKSGLNGEDITDAPLPSGDERGAQMDSRSESSSTNGNGDRRQYAPEGTEEMGSEEDQDEDYADDGEEGANEEGADSTSTTTTKNEDGSESLVVSMYGSPSLVKVRSMFIDKLYKMVEDSAIQHLIAWAKDGDMFYVFNCIELSASVLPKFFKHNNWQSFVRQLNMYGFHKIYRYDREESTMNRRNPETQRWQFYHPDFQRDRPHLRNNIKRKSARSVNLQPTFSRVVFDREKGYYMSQDVPAPRPFHNQGGHIRSHSSNHLHDAGRHGQFHPPPPATAPQHYPHASRAHHDPAQRPSPIRSHADYRPPPPPPSYDSPNYREHPDYMTSKHNAPPPSHPSESRRMHEHGPHSTGQPLQHHYAPPSHQQHQYGAPHQRQHSYAGPPSQAHFSPDHSYGAPHGTPHGYHSPHLPPHESQHAGQPSVLHNSRPTNQAHGSSAPESGGSPESEFKHGPALTSGGHFRSQSAPGLEPRRESPRGPHPFNPQDQVPNRSPPLPPHMDSQSYFSRESYPSHRAQGGPFEDPTNPSKDHERGPLAVNHAGAGIPEGQQRSLKHPLSPMETPPTGAPHPSTPAHGQHGYAEQHHRQEHHRRNPSMAGLPSKEDPMRRFSPPSRGHSSGNGIGTPSHMSSLQPALPVEITEGGVVADVNENPNPQDLVPRTVEQLEGRLNQVEGAYRALRQVTQDLQQMQHSRDQTIAWMRDRIDQLIEGGARSEIMTSPSLTQTGVVPSKRKAEYSPGDSREWGRRGPNQGYERQGPTTGGAGNGGEDHSPGSTVARYDGSSYSHSYNPSQAPPPPPSSSSHGVPPVAAPPSGHPHPPQHTSPHLPPRQHSHHHLHSHAHPRHQHQLQSRHQPHPSLTIPPS